MPDTKPTNPKDAVGSRKLPLHLCPATGQIEWCLAQLDGALKYGPYNWREAGVRTSVYIDAIERHLKAFTEGENLAEDSAVHHLGHIMACCAIILDSGAQGNLTDDRPPPSFAFHSMLKEANTRVAARIDRQETKQ